MPYILPYDTETTGIHYGFKSRSVTDPSHPHLVQVSALVIEEESNRLKRVHQSMNLIVKPEGWDIPEETTAIHGITQEHALEWGLSEQVVLDVLLALWLGGEPNPLLRIAHNADFDKNVIATAIGRYYGEGELLDMWLEGQDFCTMKGPGIKQLVGALNVKGNLKLPKLGELYAHLFRKEIEHAHTANADVVAVGDCYFALKEVFNG